MLFNYDLSILFVIIILIMVLISLSEEINALSPNFPRQVIIDGSNDWNSTNFLSNPSSNLNSSQCRVEQSFFSSTPDIEEINYLSDGKTLNATIWLSSFFEEPSEIYSFSLNETAPKENQSTNERNLVAIDIKELKNKNSTLSQYTIQRLSSLRELPSFRSETVSTTILSNNLAHKVSYTYKTQNEDMQALKIWTIANDKVYTITYTAEKERYSYYSPIVQNLIKSFNFDNRNSAILNQSTIDGYQTYINKKMGIELQYPNEWRMEISKENPELILFYPPFKESLYRTGRSIVMAMDINSGYDFRGEDYRVTLDWDPSIRNWTRLVQESRSSLGEDHTLDSGEYIVLEKEDNYVGFFNKEKNYVKLIMNLSSINFPDQYSLVFFVTDGYQNRKATCNIDLFDMSDEVHIPPPDFTFTVSPSSVSLRPEEQREMELQIKNTNAKLNSYVVLSTNKSKGIEVSFIPNSISVPPSGLSTSVINIKAADNAGHRPHTFQITANITFPSQLTNYLTNEKFNNTGGARITEQSDVTVTVLPPVSFQEQFNNIITNWFNPLTSIYTTIIGIITGILGWRVWKRKKKGEENEQRK